MASKIFISYRREDSAGHAGRVKDRLEGEFGRELLFMDVDAIPLGMNFIKVLREEVAQCSVLLAVIGPNLLDARDENGNRRLDNGSDFVRVEIAAALQRDIPVIPVLLGGTSVPKADQLPEDIKELAERNGLDVRHTSFHSDLDKLVRGIRGYQAGKPSHPLSVEEPGKAAANSAAVKVAGQRDSILSKRASIWIISSIKFRRWTTLVGLVIAITSGALLYYVSPLRNATTLDTSDAVRSTPSAAAEEAWQTGWKYYSADNYAAALPLFRRAAQSNHIQALQSIAYMYDNGKGVQEDHTEAARWYRKAAELGDPLAANELCYRYQKGFFEIRPDAQEAARWCKPQPSKP